MNEITIHPRYGRVLHHRRQAVDVPGSLSYGRCVRLGSVKLYFQCEQVGYETTFATDERIDYQRSNTGAQILGLSRRSLPFKLFDDLARIAGGRRSIAVLAWETQEIPAEHPFIVTLVDGQVYKVRSTRTSLFRRFWASDIRSEVRYRRCNP